MRKLLLGLWVLAIASGASAQTGVTTDRIYLGATGCRLSTGATAPTGGASCDWYLDTSTGHVWANHGGTWIDTSTRTPTFQTVTASGAITAASVAAATMAASTSVTTPRIAASGALTLAPVGAVVLDPGSRTVLPGSNFGVSFGAPEQKFLALHLGELWTESLVAQQRIATIGGRVLVAPTNLLVEDLAAASTNIVVKYNNLRNGDVVYMEANGRVEFMSIASNVVGTGPYTYGVVRNLDGSGADLWYAGDAVVDTGTTGNGTIDLYATNGILTGFGPTIVGNVRTGTAYNAIAPRFALGNLNGVYYHNTDTYGFAAGNPAGAFVYLDDTNGLVMGTATTGASVQITPSGAASFSGQVTAASGNIAGWTIGTDLLMKQTGTLYSGLYSSNASNVRFFAGAVAGGIDTAPFRVYADGSVVMSAATVTAPNAGAGGSALNADADTRDLGLWQSCAGCTIVNIPDGKVGGWSLRSPAGVAVAPFETRKVPYDPAKTYRFHVWARSGGGANGVFYAGLSGYDAAGTECDTANCPSGGARLFYCAVTETGASLATWKEFNCSIGAGTGYPVAPGVRSLSVQALMNVAGGSAGWFEIQDIRLEEMSPATLIKDGAITTSKITAGAITTAELNATGYGDNLIKNGAFEPNVGENIGGGPTSSALAGWVMAEDSQTSLQLGNQCCGILGPGTLYLNVAPGDQYIGAAYLAVPIEGSLGLSTGVKYRISFRVHASGVAGPHMYVIVAEYNGAQGGIRRVVRGSAPIGSGGTYPDVNRTSEQILAACVPINAEWTTVEFTYTPTPGVRMASLHLYNTSPVCGGTQTALHYDDVEFQKQIGTGHISANSITANLIQAGAITADKIAAGVITADKIAAGTITGDKIAADQINGGHIVAGTITSSDIATGTITADRLNVTALSAITANLGSVTAGNLSAVAISGGTIDGTTIRGVTISASSSVSGATITGGSITSGTSITGATIDGSTITAGGGSVVLNASGITVGNGDSNGNARIKLGPSELWGGSFGLSTASGMNAGALNVTGGSHLQGAVTMDGNATVGAVLTVNNYESLNGNLQFENGQTLYWPTSFPTSGSGGQMVFVNACRCLGLLSSSSRFKENIRPWSAPDPLRILSLPLVRYDFKNAPGVIASQNNVGFMVEDLVRLAPDAVITDARGPTTYSQQTLDAYLLAAIRAVNDRATRLDGLAARASRVEELERTIADLQKRIAVLERKGKQ